MGKKQSSGKHYTSKGLIGPNKKLSNAVRRERPAADRFNAQFDAYLRGKNVVFTIDNPNPKETAKRKIRVNARDLYGDHKEFLYGKKQEKRR